MLGHLNVNKEYSCKILDEEKPDKMNSFSQVLFGPVYSQIFPNLNKTKYTHLQFLNLYLTFLFQYFNYYALIFKK